MWYFEGALFFYIIFLLFVAWNWDLSQIIFGQKITKAAKVEGIVRTTAAGNREIASKRPIDASWRIMNEGWR